MIPAVIEIIDMKETETGRPGVLRFMGSQRVGHDWAAELNWTPRIAMKEEKFLSYRSIWLICLNAKMTMTLLALYKNFSLYKWVPFDIELLSMLKVYK